MAINDYFKMQRVINGLDLSRPVYKYIPLKYVITMLKTQKLYVGKVKKQTFECRQFDGSNIWSVLDFTK